MTIEIGFTNRKAETLFGQDTKITYWTNELGDNKRLTCLLEMWAEQLQQSDFADEIEVGVNLEQAIQTLSKKNITSWEVNLDVGGQLIALYNRNGEWRLGTYSHIFNLDTLLYPIKMHIETVIF